MVSGIVNLHEAHLFRNYQGWTWFKSFIICKVYKFNMYLQYQFMQWPFSCGEKRNLQNLNAALHWLILDEKHPIWGAQTPFPDCQENLESNLMIWTCSDLICPFLKSIPLRHRFALSASLFRIFLFPFDSGFVSFWVRFFVFQVPTVLPSDIL